MRTLSLSEKLVQVLRYHQARQLEEQIARDAHVKVYANLYGDTLGPPGYPGATYIGMERSNMKALVAGFLGE